MEAASFLFGHRVGGSLTNMFYDMGAGLSIKTSAQDTCWIVLFQDLSVFMSLLSSLCFPLSTLFES